MIQATRVVQSFFEAYRAHDIESMVSLCSDGADFHYVPFEIWGKQRVLRGDGKVRGIGKVLWTGLIESFPDLTNEVTSIHADRAGHVAAEVTIRGTQAKVWGSIDSLGRGFSLRHLFLFGVGDSGLIHAVSAYWDSADLHRLLGRIEID
ncbi:MAG TPA: nuclear transport factor 2 family protein [Polyangiaceae bacterium]|nr:nuclear transport factor 2 family protein [Polyangiaceae bacterium]